MLILTSMPLGLESFTEPVASVLAGYPDVNLPLLQSDLPQHSRLEAIAKSSAKLLFPDAREPECAHSGLLLVLGGWAYSHQLAQDVAGAEGSYWHAIAHRIEPDTWNSGYWFRRLGRHAIFEPLATGALEISHEHGDGWEAPKPWDPFAFLSFCEKAVKQIGSPKYKLAVAIQSLEWRLLFEYCALPRTT